MTVEELQVLITAKTADLKKELAKVKKELGGVDKEVKTTTSNIKTAFKSVAAVLATIGISAGIKSATSEAMRFEAALGQIQRLMANNSSTFQRWVDENATAFGMGRAEAIRYGAVYANLLSSFTSSTAQTTQYTQDLLKASAVVATSTGRTMEDTMERIRSGLLGNTEAIEDLGININVAMVESTEAFKRFANGRSWDQLSFQTQQQIRYFAILEQAASKYGLEIAQNTSSRQAQFTAQLKDAKLALGQAFLPIIYNSVLPALTSMAAALANTMRYIAAFTQALFGYNQDQQIKATEKQASAVSSIGDAYQEAGKKIRGSLTGFDEVNQLADQSGGAAGISSGAMPLDTGIGVGDMSYITAPMEEVAAKAQEMAEKVKAAFGEMSAAIREHKDIILSALAGLAAGVATFLILANWSKIVSAFETLYLVALYALDAIKAAWVALTGPIGLIALAVAAVVAAFIYFYRTNETFRGVVDGILQKIGEVATWLWNDVLVPFGQWLATVFVAAWEGVKTAAQWLWQNILVPFGNYLLWFWNTVIKPLGSVLKDYLAIAFKGVADIALLLWQNVLVPLGDFLATIFVKGVQSVIEILIYWWYSTLKPLGEFLIAVFKPIIEKIIEVFMFLWQNVLKPLIEFMAGVFVKTFENVTSTIKTIIEGLKKVFSGVIDFITGVFTGNWEKAWEGVKQIFSGIWDTIKTIFKATINGIISGINLVIRAWNKIEMKVPEINIPFVGTFGGYTISVPKISEIPMLARGGIVDSPTLAMIGEAGKEAVVPLENTAFVNTLASAIGTAVLNAMQVSNNSGQNKERSGDISIVLDGTIIARILNPYLATEQQRIGTTAIIKTT